ncbi:hypothetical protein HDU97_006587 [Phlyctochytrium planicorne]|nr:hypothetical protein HDU97_006587 [Phlyctochytrium planicorne]
MRDHDEEEDGVRSNGRPRKDRRSRTSKVTISPSICDGRSHHCDEISSIRGEGTATGQQIACESFKSLKDHFGQGNDASEIKVREGYDTGKKRDRKAAVKEWFSTFSMVHKLAAKHAVEIAGLFSIAAVVFRVIFAVSCYTRDGTGKQYQQDASVFGLLLYLSARFGGSAFAQTQKIVLIRDRLDVFLLGVMVNTYPEHRQRITVPCTFTKPASIQALYWRFQPQLTSTDLVKFMAMCLPLYYFAAFLMVYDKSKPIFKALLSLLVNGLAYAMFAFTSGAAIGYCFYFYLLGQKEFAMGRWDGGVLSTLFVSFGYPSLAVLLPSLFRMNVIWKKQKYGTTEEHREALRKKIQFTVTYDCLLGLVQKLLILRSTNWTFYILSEIGTHVFDICRRYTLVRLCQHRMRRLQTHPESPEAGIQVVIDAESVERLKESRGEEEVLFEVKMKGLQGLN